MIRNGFIVSVLCSLLAAACGSDHDVPVNPTWADVEPIVRANCTHCHGALADEAGAWMGTSYRFDFFDMTTQVCGEAADALGTRLLADALAELMAEAITPPAGGGRARMPPLPATALEDWERETILRWSEQGSIKGAPNSDNLRPDIHLDGKSGVADTRLQFTAAIRDPQGEPVVGVLRIGNHRFMMDHPGAYQGDIDTSAWPAGTYPVSAVVCDGWDSFRYELGNAKIEH